jgi:hypothetical protein
MDGRALQALYGLEWMNGRCHCMGLQSMDVYA